MLSCFVFPRWYLPSHRGGGRKILHPFDRGGHKISRCKFAQFFRPPLPFLGYVPKRKKEKRKKKKKERKEKRKKERKKERKKDIMFPVLRLTSFSCSFLEYFSMTCAAFSLYLSISCCTATPK